MKDPNCYRPEPKSWADVFVALLFAALFIVFAAVAIAAFGAYIAKSLIQ